MVYLKISKWLREFGYKLRQKSLYYELLHYIKKKQFYLKPIHCYDCGIGKTYTLLKLAHKYKLPIYVGSQIMKRRVMSMYKDIYKTDNVVVINCNGAHNRKKYDIVLCDEGIDYESLDWNVLQNCNAAVGYNYIEDTGWLQYKSE